MLEHHRRRATKNSPTTPIGPKGCGGMTPTSSLPFLEDARASTSSRRLELGPMALATDGTRVSGRASRRLATVALNFFGVRRVGAVKHC